MKDEEFQRIKEAEKERLRTKKRLQATLDSLKRRNEVQSIVRRMSQGAKHLLERTESLANTVASEAARQAARLEVAMEDGVDDEVSLAEDEEILREDRAEAFVEGMKARNEPAASRRRSTSESKENEEKSPKDTSEDTPEKTIGRMNLDRTDEAD